MRAAPLTALVVGADAALEQLARTCVGDGDEVAFHATHDLAEAMGLVRDDRPDLVIAGGEVPAAIAFELCAHGRSHGVATAPWFALASHPLDPDTEAAARVHGVDDVLPVPATAASLRTTIHAARRLRAQRDAVSATDVTITALLEIVDLGIPGAAERAERITDLARHVAARCGVPARLMRDLEIAARLHALGRIIALARHRAEGWQYTMATCAVLRKIEGLEDATDLVARMYENWDGTGSPDHLMQGQIPLRSRILRAVVDLFDESDRLRTPDLHAVVERLSEHMGTRYDIKVIHHLTELLEEGADAGWQGDHVMVAITDLRVGMVLAQDLFTDAGLKLLARGTTITEVPLETILRRHRMEPILRGAAVTRSAA